MKDTKVMHLLSGGLDSTVLLYDLQSQGCLVHCVLFDYKQKHIQELNWARHHCRRLNVLFTTIELPMLRGSELTDGQGSAILPFRNSILLSLAVNLAAAAGSRAVTFAANKNDEAMFPDCRMAFVQQFNVLLLNAEIPIEVCAPYLDKQKWEIADLGRQLGVKFEETWSCYRGGRKPCGECEACKKREAALNKP